MVKRTDRLYAVGELPELFVLPKKMHAWTLRTETLGEPISAFREEIVDVPQAGKGEVIVANLCASINYNGVWAALGKPKNVVAANGNYGDKKEDFHICGSEASGIVYDVGEGVTHLKIGDRVTVSAAQFDPNCPIVQAGGDPVNSPSYRIWGYEANWGGFAQFSKVMAMQCHKIPDGMSDVEASAFASAGVVAYRMLTHWQGNTVKKGDVVLIYGGSGGIGSIAITITKALGGIPIAVVSSDERGELCKQLGAKGYINRTKFKHWGTPVDYLDPDKQRKWIYEAMKFKAAIWKIVGKKQSPAIVIEHPGADTIPTSVFVCDNNGMVVLCGATSSYFASVDLRYLWIGQRRLQGCHSGAEEDFDNYLRFMAEYKIKQPIGHIFSWSEVPLAHQLAYEDKSYYGKNVIRIVP